MSSSFGNNKRKPGATAGAVTEAKRRATLAQNWDDYSKQPKVAGASIVPSIMGRNAGIQSIFYAQNNGYIPTIPSLQYISGLLFSGYLRSGGTPIISNPSLWGIPDDTIIPVILNSAYATNGIFISMAGTQNPPANSALYINGFFRAPISGSYIFNIYRDDTLEIKLNNQTIVSSTTNSGFITSTPIQLIGGTYYPLQILISNNTGGFRFFIRTITVDSIVKFNLGTGTNQTPSLNTVPSINTLPLSSCFAYLAPVPPPMYLPVYPNVAIPTISQATRNCISFVHNPTTPNYISTPYTGNLLLQTTDQAIFTIEWFQKMNTVPTDGGAAPAYPRPWAIGQNAIGPLSTAFELPGNQFRLWWATNTGFTYQASSAIPGATLKQWCHFAIVVIPDVPGSIRYKVFMNGVLILNNTKNPLIQTTTPPAPLELCIGNWQNTNINQNAQFDGYITGFKWTVGQALYTIPFTPPAFPLSISASTDLLLNVANAGAVFTDSITSTNLTATTLAPTFANI